MSAFLISQQIEISYGEGMQLCKTIYTWLSRPVDHTNKLEPFEVLAAVHLKLFYSKLYKRLPKQKHKISKFKITLSAPEIIAIFEIINTYPVELYHVLSEIERKALNYDQVVNFNFITN